MIAMALKLDLLLLLPIACAIKISDRSIVSLYKGLRCMLPWRRDVSREDTELEHLRIP